MAEDDTKAEKSERVNIIGAIKTYLGFFTLIVLVVEAVLGTLALNTDGENQLFALYSMIAIIVLLIFIITFFAYKKPAALLGSAEHFSATEKSPTDDFCNLIAGYWWESINPNDTSAISFVEISTDPSSHSIKMKGIAYSKTGSVAAMWDSVACCVKYNEKKLFYYWQGWHPDRPEQKYEGFGEISFSASQNEIDNAVGFYSDSNISDLKSTSKKSIQFQRSTDAEQKIMQTNNTANKVALILEKLNG